MRLPFWAVLVTVLGSFVLQNSTGAQVQGESKPLGNRTAGDIAKIQVNFEFTNKLVDFAASLSDTIQDIHIFFEPSKTLKVLEGISLIAKALGPAVSALQVIGTFLQILSTFLLPSIQGILKEEFHRVNLKLDALSQQLQKVGEKLESSIEFHSWFPTYTDYKFRIMNGEKKLTQAMSQMKATTDDRQKIRSIKEYTDYYKSQDIEGTMMNIFRLTARDGTDTQPNLFSVYNNKHYCNIKGLSQLMLAILLLTFSGSKQMSAFSILTNKSQADERLQDIYGEIENVKHQYEKQVWPCFTNAISRAKITTNDIMTGNPEMTGTELSTNIQRNLSDLAPWYKWSVAQYEQTLDFRQAMLPTGYAERYCDKGISTHRGHQMFIREHNDRKILVMWEEKNNKSHECHQITEPDTFVPFQLCKNCNADVLQTSNDTLYGQRCPDFLQSTFSRICRDPLGQISQMLSRYTFLAVGVQSANRPCQKNTCGGHGSCRAIPDTNQYMCFCHQFYSGKNCETRNNPADSLLARDLIASLRSNFSNFIGIPDVIDVYFELQKFPDQLQEMQKNIEGVHKYNRKLIFYGDGFDKTELVAEKYSRLLSGDISEDKFGKDLEKLDLNFEYRLWQLKKMVLGSGIFVSEGMLSSLKKSQRADFVCTENYNKRISEFMRDLLILDEEVTEAQLRFLNWKLRNKDPSEEQDPLRKMTRIRDMAVARQKSYVQHWEKNSCQELSAENLIQNCTKSMSYEGLSVMLNCSERMTPSVPSVTCQKVNGTLQWSAKPICQYVWSSWSPWSDCSKICGGGQRNRTRQKPNGETDTEIQSCGTEDCCQSKYGKFKCDNGQCVPYSYTCDGDLDCNDGSDESDARQCSYLRDGDTIALKNGCRRFMSCCSWYTSHNDIVHISDSPGDSMDWIDWKIFSNVQFRVDLFQKGRDKGPIRFGDEIMITSKISGICMNCRYHGFHWIAFGTGFGNVCRTTETGSGNHRCKTKIFARNRLGGCSGYVYNGCKGDPIRVGDVVYLLQSEWVSGDDSWVHRRTCPGDTITPLTGCACEQWTVFRG